MLKVAALQFAIGTDIQANLATCLRMIEQGAETGAKLLVLPEFSNHLSWYKDQAHAYEVSVDEDGDFIRSIQSHAKQYQVYLIINCSTRRPQNKATITSFLINPAGEKIAVIDKQTLMGQENDYFERSNKLTPLAVTEIGKIGIYACRDGVTMEAPRSLAIRGAQILCISLHSFAFDEAELHIPSRAPENKAFVISANKVGPLIPEAMLQIASEKLGVAKELLYGAGESQIVSPLGEVLAKGPKDAEAVVVAEIDISESDLKLQPDHTDIFANRRPELYAEIAQAPTPYQDHPVAEKIKVGVYQPSHTENQAIAEVCKIIETHKKQLALLTLPQLFFSENVSKFDLAKSTALSQTAVKAIQAACNQSELLVCTSIIENEHHLGVLIGANGVIFKQAQLHYDNSKPWAKLGDQIHTIDLPWGRFGILVGNDHIYPEVAKVLAIQSVDVLGVPFDAKEAWELNLGLVDRSAENRVCIVAATRPKPFGNSLIINQWRDFQIFTPWQDHKFEGRINAPIVTRMKAPSGLLIETIHPATAKNKVMSRNTDLIHGRPWYLSQILTEPIAEIDKPDYFVHENN